MMMIIWLIAVWFGLIVDMMVMPYVSFNGAHVELALVIVSLAALREGQAMAYGIAILAGFAADLLCGTSFGVSIATYLLVTTMIFFLRRNAVSNYLILRISAAIGGSIVTVLANLAFSAYYGMPFDYVGMFVFWMIPFAVMQVLAIIVISICFGPVYRVINNRLG